ncbi:uncharacterized protein A4U43_C05F28020 [Asparagus officinalis]|uniref:Uncharacterized protein n=1 Tax=Asparagus officinalis TaxID=4686 RepID=A0A5P1F0F0_ASPOF|nr:uncharacterized protein A4U43_C05F28020 [Asparagus officinalis]
MSFRKRGRESAVVFGRLGGVAEDEAVFEGGGGGLGGGGGGDGDGDLVVFGERAERGGRGSGEEVFSDEGGIPSFRGEEENFHGGCLRLGGEEGRGDFRGERRRELLGFGFIQFIIEFCLGISKGEYGTRHDVLQSDRDFRCVLRFGILERCSSLEL